MEKNKDLWILALNMTKAYGWINIYMLEKVMKHIRFLNNLCKLLINLFLERKNRIFTPAKAYDMQVDIGQGKM